MRDELEIRMKIAEASDALSAKVISMVVLGLSSFVLGILPIHLTKHINVKTVEGDKNLLISLLLCFGGGVLLYTTFIHLQPEVRQSFTLLDLEEKIPLLADFPISEIVFCLGFFFVYLIEEIVHLCLHKKIHIEVLDRSMSIRCKKKGKDGQIAIPRVSLNKSDDGTISSISNSNKQLFNSHSTINIDQKQLNHHNHLPGDLKNSFSGLLAVLALSFHAVFEGLAVGLETSEHKVWVLFGAIATHKLVIAFCVGVELVTSGTKTILTILYIGTFSIVTPLGIGIGLLLSKNENGLDITSTILQGMAAGTLLYVVFFEVLSRERSNEHSGLYQLFCIIIGFAVMTVMQLMTGHDHGSHHHNHDHDHHNHVSDLTHQVLNLN